jgi:UDP-GlcNAc:undecaprenyl-phosphate GlcNAc-1-phosphate transferase
MSTDDVFVTIKASVVATLLSVAAITFIYRFHDFSKGIFFIDFLTTTGLLLGTRGSFRIYQDKLKRNTLEGDKVLIYGAGRGGEILLREIINNRRLGVNPIGFVDDDPIKNGKKLQGYPILGTFNDAERLLEQHGFTGVLVSFNGESPEGLEAACKFCQEKHLFLRKFFIGLREMDPHKPGERLKAIR